MNYELQFARITNSGKLPDRYLTCRHTSSHDLSEAVSGDVFTLVEILSPWFPTAQVGQMINNDFSKFYFQAGSTSNLANFEEGIKNINENLAQVTQNGETEWIGNLNSILAVVVENSLHLSSTGKAQAFIFRDGKVNHLTEGLTNGAEIHPLKTFSNVISGEIKSHDQILITNGELFDHLSVESVQQIITLNDPSTATMQISKLLHKAHVKNVNLIVINVLSQDEASAETLGENTETVFYLDKSSDSFLVGLKAIGGKITPVGKTITGLFRRSSAKPSEVAQSPLPVSKPVSNKPTTKAKEPAVTKPVTDKFDHEFLANNPRDDILLKDEEINYSPEYTHYYKNEAQAKESNKIIPFLKNIYSKILGLIFALIEIAKDKNRRKYIYIAVAVLIVLSVILFVYFRGRGTRVGNLEAQKILDQAIAAEKEGQQLLNSGDQASAKEKLASAIEQANSIKSNVLVSKDAKDLLNSAYQVLDSLTGTTRVNELKSINEISENVKLLFVASGESYLCSDTDIYKASLLGGSPSKQASLPKGKGSIISGARADKIIYLLTSTDQVFSYDTSTDKLESVSLTAGQWEQADIIAYYVGNIYLLNSGPGQIYKHVSNGSGFGQGSEYIQTTNINIRDSVSLAVDGSLYVLKKDGQTVKIQRSKEQDFSLQKIPTPNDSISDPKKIFTDSDTPSLYILDASLKRIVEFDKDGVYVHQYALPDSFNQIDDFVVSVKAKKIWLLEKNKIYEISI